MTRAQASRRPSSVQVATVLRDAITRVNRRLRRTRPVGDLTIAQLSALHSLDAAGALTPRELSDTERVQPPTMTRIVARLEERALVQRSPHPTDGRQVILALTPAGRELIAENRRVRDEWLARRLALLTTEEREIVQRAAEIMTRIARD
jgi:DNA-binding MarR family transcriptional regulator